MTKNDLSKFEEKIGYRFQKKDLLQNALTHSSYANEKHLPYEKNNERLEFLGDAVLELVSSDFILCVKGVWHRVPEKLTLVPICF